VNFVIQIFKLLVMSFVNAFKMAGDFFGNLGVMVFGVVKFVGDIIGNLAVFILGIFKGIFGAIRPIGALIRAIFTGDLEGIKTAFEDLKKGAVSGLGLIKTAAREYAIDLETNWGLIAAAGKQAVADFVTGGQVIRDQLTASADAALALVDALMGVQAARGGARGGAQGGARAPSAADLVERGVVGFGIGGVRLPDFKNIPFIQEVEQLIREITEETLRMVDEMGGVIQSGIAETIGDSIFNGLQAAFDTGSLLGFFEQFGKTLLAGFGDIMVQLGKILIQYGLTMTALRPFLMNIFTAGPAAIAAGIALTALGSAFSSIVSSSGGAGRGMATAGAFREPNYGFAEQSADVSRQTISMGSAPTIKPQPAPIYNVIIGPDDPTAQRQIVALIRKAQRRGFAF